MKATFALLLDHHVHNMVRKLAVEVHQAYQIGLVGSQLPPHVSFKQPFLIADLSALEAYFDQLAKSIDPLILSFPASEDQETPRSYGWKWKKPKRSDNSTPESTKN